ncbi:MAG: PEPxxWA-CTERM sorting domain-containing protein [Novosphingobium sp.]|jgi:hypothetical protein|uniref:PEPxxWA-CTERM sorting domain-containing protein n=1 Tax=Novosphingobium sp. TaxID=1874826 RepID=UPI003B9A5067
MWKKMMIPAAAAAAVLASPVSAATTLSVQTNNNAGWAVITPNGSTVTPNVVARNSAWANTSWISTGASGSSNVPAGQYRYIYTLSQPGLFGLLSGLVYVDNRLLSIFVNGNPLNGVNFPLNSNGGEFQFQTANGRQINFDLSSFGVINSITFVTRNDGTSANPAGLSANLSAPAIPEPGTWMLMILGLGAVGFAMRRRQSTSVRMQFA